MIGAPPGWSARKLVTSYAFESNTIQQSFLLLCFATSAPSIRDMIDLFVMPSISGDTDLWLGQPPARQLKLRGSRRIGYTAPQDSETRPASRAGQLRPNNAFEAKHSIAIVASMLHSSWLKCACNLVGPATVASCADHRLETCNLHGSSSARGHFSCQGNWSRTKLIRVCNRILEGQFNYFLTKQSGTSSSDISMDRMVSMALARKLRS